jgi:hypothetical protein
MDIIGGGFSSIEDREGNDWVAWGPNDGNRGIPNLRFPANVFHPGRDKCTTWVESEDDDHVLLISTSKDKKWETRWSIDENVATCTVTKVPMSYWFLYEGAPGGTFDKEEDYWIKNDGTTGDCGTGFGGDMAAPEWVCFGDNALDRVLFFLHHEDDSHDDNYFAQGMTVFGFGRGSCGKCMTETPQTFTIGFLETTDYATIAGQMDALLDGGTVALRDGYPLLAPQRAASPATEWGWFGVDGRLLNRTGDRSGGSGWSVRVARERVVRLRP